MSEKKNQINFVEIQDQWYMDVCIAPFHISLLSLLSILQVKKLTFYSFNVEELRYVFWV